MWKSGKVHAKINFDVVKSKIWGNLESRKCGNQEKVYVKVNFE